MTKLIFIHGINNQDNSASVIRDQWTEALSDSLRNLGLSLPSDIEVDAAFYGDVLHHETQSWGKSLGSASAMSVNSPDDDFVSGAEASLFLEIQRAYGIEDTTVADFLDKEDEKPSATIMAKGIHKKWLKAIARALEAVIPTRGKFLARIFLKQASAYLEKEGLKEQIDDMVYNQVFSGIKPEDKVVIVSHSLGTVVAYSLLRQSTTQIKPILFVTAGSPLGIDIVKQRLGPPLICPPNVPSWLNVSDKEDFVAFKPSLNASTFGCDQVENHTAIDNGYEDAHDIQMYLKYGITSKAIYNALTQ